MPGAVSALEQAGQPYRMCRAVLGAAADAVCRAGAARLVTPATVPVARSRSEVSEAVLAGLAGVPFTAAARAASEMADDMARWTTPVTSDRAARLTVRLASPEDDGGWLLTVESSEPGQNGDASVPLPVEEVLHSGRPARAAAVETELRRLERLLPALRRPGRRRGKVVLDGTEAWELMTGGGAVLEAAGFIVRVPRLAKKRSTPRLQLHAEAFGGPSVVGAQQLSRVQWSVAVDDVTLDAAAIRKLANSARPLVETKGGWVELDKADLEAAAAALAERRQGQGTLGRRHPPPRRGPRRGRRRPGAGRRRRLGRRPRPRRRRRGRQAAAGPRRLRRGAPPLPGRGPGVARVPRPGGPGRLPGHGHGPRQDPHRPRPPAGAAGRGAVAGDRPAGRARQLGRRGGPVHAGAGRPDAPRLQPGVGRGRGRRGRRGRPRPHHLRHGGARRRGAGQDRVGPAHRRRGPGHQEPGQRHRPGAAADPGPQPPGPHRHAGGERPRRPVVDPRLHQPRPRRAPPGVHRAAVPSPGGAAESGSPRRRGPDGSGAGEAGAEGRGAGAAGPQRAAGLPPHEGGAGDRRRAARQDRRARPLRHDPRAGRAVPGRPRQPPGQRHRAPTPTPPPRRATSSPPSPI